MESGASEGETEHMLSSRSRDLLLRFSGRFSPDEAEEAGSGESDEIELGLSLGGCFNNSLKNRILRSSSIPAILPSELPPIIPLSRACSLQSETEEEMWRRKEMQSMKRKEAKRKREERMNFRRVGERTEELEEGSVVKLRRFEVDNGGSWIPGGGPANGGFHPVVASWIAGAGLTTMKAVEPASQGSGVSQGSSSSGGSELESRPEQGFELSGFSYSSEVRNSSTASPFPPSSATLISKSNNGSTITNAIVSNENLLSKSEGRCSNGSGELSKSMEEMPSVSTKGEGPNGRRIEGFLYKYRRGEEVRIVCVCHGSFLTPAEFVKHAGGGDVAHPLRHIVVNPTPASFL